MANYKLCCRSSYFLVRDVEKYLAWCSGFGLNSISNNVEGETLYGFVAPDGIPCPADTGTDFAEELANHLADGWVAVVQEVGFEKTRYSVGFVFAVDWKNNYRDVSLHDIYGKAKELGKCTSATY